MNREEAIYKAKHLRKVRPNICVDAEDFWETVIAALEQEPCDDAISRQAVLELVANYDLSMGQVVKGIHALPPVTPQQKMGRWINAKVGKIFPSNDYKCSECGNILDFDGVNCGRGDANYCPNCGAKMEVK